MYTSRDQNSYTKMGVTCAMIWVKERVINLSSFRDAFFNPGQFAHGVINIMLFVRVLEINI